LDHASNSRPILASWTAVVCATAFLAACGGAAGPNDAGPHADAMYAMTEVAHTSQAKDMPVRSRAVFPADPASFTLNPASQFKGFNHGMWNRPRSWTECDCGSDSTPAAGPWGR
jgi:hypothetical protein